jgi:hypothetical protein
MEAGAKSATDGVKQLGSVGRGFPSERCKGGPDCWWVSAKLLEGELPLGVASMACHRRNSRNLRPHSLTVG